MRWCFTHNQLAGWRDDYSVCPIGGVGSPWNVPCTDVGDMVPVRLGVEYRFVDYEEPYENAES